MPSFQDEEWREGLLLDVVLHRLTSAAAWRAAAGAGKTCGCYRDHMRVIVLVMSRTTSSRGAAQYARVLAVAVLVGGMVSSFLMAKASKQRHESEVAQLFQAECTSMRNAVARQVDLFFEVLASIGQLHELSDQISAEDFAEFTSKGMQFQKRILSAYGFVQRLPHELRMAMADRGEDKLVILEPDAMGRHVVAGIRPEYYPLVYQNPEGALALPLGMDVGALPGMADAIIRMYQQKAPVIVSHMRMQTRDGVAGYFVLSPIYQQSMEAGEYLSGFTVSILWPQDILERALSDVPTRDVLIRFFDPALHVDHGDDPAQTLEVIEEITVADSTWRFQARASKEYITARLTILPGVIRLSGAAITILLAAMIWQLAGRTRRIEQVVTERTKELQSANQRLSEAMHDRMRLEHEILEISEREKQQVGQDLHDSLGQKLTGAVFLSRALASHLSGQDSEAIGQAARINEILKESVAQVRRMARGLSPVDMGDEGLGGALRRLAEETSSVYGITCLFHEAEGVPAPPSKIAHHLYAIALEAVTNAVRHGHAKEIVIELGQNAERGMLVIEDDGCGFNPSTTQRGGMGLRIMQYRATMIGGQLEVTRRPTGGMNVMCLFPKEEKTAPAAR